MMLHDDDIRTLLAEARVAGDAKQAEAAEILRAAADELHARIAMLRARCADAVRAARELGSRWPDDAHDRSLDNHADDVAECHDVPADDAKEWGML